MSIIDKLTKKFDSANMVKFSEINIFDDKDSWIHSGVPELDYNLGTLGFGSGVIEISGASKSGKTTIALNSMNEFLTKHPDGVGVILSSEERDNKIYAEKIGIDTNRIIIIKSKFVEDLFFQFQEVIDETGRIWKEEKLAGKPKIFAFWDSCGATNSRAEVETFKKNIEINRKNINDGTKTELKNSKMGDFAKSATMCMKAMLAQIHQNSICFIILNHLKDKMDGGNGKYTPGGKWLEYLPSIRLQMSRTEWIKVGEQEVAQLSNIKIDKNDYGSRRNTSVEILLGYGIVLNQHDIEYAVSKGILKKDGVRKMSFANGKMTWSTKREFYELYKNRNKMLSTLHKLIKNARHKEVLESKV